jgi:ELWxxDGT repeat protein
MIGHVGLSSAVVALAVLASSGMAMADVGEDGSTPVLVKDIEATSEGSSPEEFVRAGDALFFEASDPLHGPELWRSDGTEAGTVLVKDIKPGPQSSRYGGGGPTHLAAIGDTVFFVADDGMHGPSLWRSDGTAEGTSMVSPGSASKLTKIGDTLYFVRESGLSDQLWKSDGTAAGTVMVVDLEPHPPRSTRVDELTDIDGTLYFTFSPSDADAKRELWKSDGSAAGTVRLTSNDSMELTRAGDALFFMVGGSHTELWTTDGTGEGTRVVKQIDPRHPSGHRTHSPLAVGDILYFIGNDESNGRELWRSDGTEAGTARVTDIGAGELDAGIESLAQVDGVLFFLAQGGLWRVEGPSADAELVAEVAGERIAPLNGELVILGAGGAVWRSDGTAEGTGKVAEIEGGIDLPYLGELGLLGDAVLMAASDPRHGLELWKSDGTQDGTVLVKDINASGNSLPREMVDAAGTLFFTARAVEYGWELWRSDGSEGGTSLVKDIRPGPEASNPFGSHAVGETVFFVADDGVHGGELWRSDGSEGGTSLVKDIRPGPTGAGVTGLTSIGETVFFVAGDGVHGRELWRSDGSEGGTSLVKDVGLVEELTRVGDRLYFRASDSSHGFEPWTSDGTAAGTFMLADVNPGSAGSVVWDILDWDARYPRPYEFTGAGDAVFFTATATDGFGRDLWRSDGTIAGTARVDDAIVPSGGDVENLIGFRGGVHFFTAGKWWRHDPVTGTAPMGSVIPTPDNPFTFFDVDGFLRAPTHVEVDGTLLFSGASVGSSTGRELWRSDGTSAGTQLVRDIDPGRADSVPVHFIAEAAGSALFTAEDQAHGRELWRSDGTPAGTAMVADVAPGSIGGLDYAFDLVRSGGRIFFAADDLATGIELWAIDEPEPEPEPDPGVVEPPAPGDGPVPPNAGGPAPPPGLVSGQPAAPLGKPMSGSRPARRRLTGRLVVEGPAKASARRLRLSVSCARPVRCRGTIGVRARGRGPRRRAGRPLAWGRYTVGAGASTTLTLTLSERGRALIGRRRSLQAKVDGPRVEGRLIRIARTGGHPRPSPRS